ncbi:MAG: hypothetical protein S4CHLAM81_08420 [Chlamydiales bacterium]|nr:hypothetical protein [Chlamydiales bacterium]MCH9635624.1 hypothetical protein [Chlamydiales bacterium]MCH9703297.1 calcium/sodium antiporter [Chlamydiota bacterium]
MIAFCVGLILLIVGAKLLVSGASGIGQRFGLSPLIIGLTIVAFGTSSPEIALCSLASWRGESEVVIGNILGSNIFNLLFVLGLVALVCPVVVKRRLLIWDVPIMIFASGLFWAFSTFGVISRPEGALLFIGILLYIFFAFRMLKDDEVISSEPVEGPWPLFIFNLVLGLLLLSFGSDRLLTGLESLAIAWGFSPLFLSLTMVAIGTSLPELFTTIACLAKREPEMALGALIGSNIFNIFAVGGISALVRPIEVSSSANLFDFPVMVATAVAALPIALTGHRIARWEGALFIFYYLFYITYIMLQTTNVGLLPLFESAFLFFLLPLTLITLAITLWRHLRNRA